MVVVYPTVLNALVGGIFKKIAAWKVRPDTVLADQTRLIRFLMKSSEITVFGIFVRGSKYKICIFR